MSAEAIFLIMLGLLLLAMFVGNWVFVSLGLTGILGLFLMNPAQLNMVGVQVWGTLNSPTLSAGPLFVFMGEIILRSGVSTQTYLGLSKILAFLPGGLLHTNVMSCALFAAISGSSVATAATIGTPYRLAAEAACFHGDRRKHFRFFDLRNVSDCQPGFIGQTLKRHAALFAKLRQSLSKR